MKTRRRALVIVVVGCAALGALAVSAGAVAPRGHFTDLGDRTVRDNLTGLVWQQDVSPSTQNQTASILYCSTLTTAGGGWRLPTILELRSIVDESVPYPGPAIDTTVFPGTLSEVFWSSSPVATSPSDGWYVYFPNGNASFDLGTTPNYRARCVR
jgi:hypothetical protein